MNKAKINYAVSMILIVSFLAVFITGIIKFPGLYLHRYGLPMRDITFIHDWSGVLMGILTIVHVLLNRKWIVCMTKAMMKKKGSEEKCDT